MPVQNGEYVQMNESEIISALESEFRSEFGNDIDLTESSVFATLANVLASVLSANQEQSLQEVYESGFLDTAAGGDLDKVVSIIGINRRPAIHATGVQRFSSSNPVTQDYVIQNGTTLQTGGNSPIEFETVETAVLEYIDGFESNSLASYDGDTGTGTFDTVQTHPAVGDFELQAGATAGDHIFHSGVTIKEGATVEFDVYPETDTIPIVTFGVQDASNYYQVVIDCSLANGSEELRIEKVEGGGVTQTIATTSGLDIPEGQYHHGTLTWNITGQISFELADVGSVGGTDGDAERWRDGHIGFKSGDGTASKYWDEVAMSAVSADIRAVVGGAHGNVGANSVTTIPSPPSGIDSTTNLYPVGDDSYDLLSGEPFSVGKDRETDDELRERARNTVSTGGDATHDALVNSLVNTVENVSSVTVYENKTDTDNTGSGGLPPHSFEAVVYGGDDQDIAETIHDKKALTARDYGGAHGTAVTQTVTADSNGQSFDISFSHPTAVNIDITMDVVADDTYVGDEELKDRIVKYVGGTLSDGTTQLGLDVGEDMMVDEIEEIVTGREDTGVIGFDMNASTEEITTTPSKTTNSNGLEVVSIGANEVAQTDATDGSITINVTKV